jgi:hypothetical protein
MLNSTRGGKRPNSGRKAPAGVRKSYTVRLSDTELTTITTAAHAAGTTISEYIRRKALERSE